VVTNSGDHDATWRYYYHGHQIIQANDGSGNLLMQVYHGTRYIDEVVAMRLPHGRAYVHQDANWNVTSLTDLTGAVLERYYYSPYGQMEVVAETYFGDYDGDGFVDSGDADDLCSNGEGCACEFTASVSGDCRVFDFDCDGDLDVSDETTLEALYSGLSADMQNRRIPSTTFSPAGNVFGHQGLVLDIEIDSNQNRARQYGPVHKRFFQRDPLTIDPRGRAGYRDGMNLYAYKKCRPLWGTDSSGYVLCPLECCEMICASPCTQWIADNPTPPGFVVCCCGVKTACVDYSQIDPHYSHPDVARCLLAHERTHFDSVTCSGCGLDRPDFDDQSPQAKNAEECHAHSVEEVCISQAEENCILQGGENCDELHARWLRTRCRVNAYCSGGGTYPPPGLDRCATAPLEELP